MAVVLRLRRVGLAELQVLVLAHQRPRDDAVAALHARGCSEHRRIERRDLPGGTDRDVELDIGHAERDAAEAFGVRLVDAHFIAPRTDRLDVIVVLGKSELGPFELAAHFGQPVEQRCAALDHQAGVSAHDLRPAGRQMKLAAPGIHPHVGVRDHQIRIARQSQPDAVKQLRQPLVRHLHVDVLKMDRVAEVLGGAIEALLHGRLSRVLVLGAHHNTVSAGK
jgi:hypothetical protein